MGAILWIDASSEAALIARYEQLADELNDGNHKSSESRAKIDFVKETIRRFQKRWLIVYDNFDDPEGFGTIEDYIPDSCKGSILFTSRHADTADLVTDASEEFIEVSGLEQKPAEDLLMRLSLRNAPEDKEMARQVVGKLCCHPLAITQAAAFIKKRKIPLSDFESHYQNSMRDILEHTPSLSRYRRRLSVEESEVALSAFTTWELSFQQLENQSHGEAAEGKLLHISSFVGGSSISEQLFHRYYRQSKKCGADQITELSQWISKYVTPALRASRCKDPTPVEDPESTLSCPNNITETKSREQVPDDNDSLTSSESSIQESMVSLSLSMTSSRTSYSQSLNDHNDNNYIDDTTLPKSFVSIPTSSTCSGLGQTWNHNRFAASMIRLYDLSLIQDYESNTDNGYVYHVHPLIQDWIRIRCSHDDYCRLFSMATRLVGYFVYDSFNTIAQRYDVKPDEKLFILGHIESLQTVMALWASNFNSNAETSDSTVADIWQRTLAESSFFVTQCAIFATSMYQGTVGHGMLNKLLPSGLLDRSTSLTVDDDSDLAPALIALINTHIMGGEYCEAEETSISVQQLTAQRLGLCDKTTISALTCRAQALSLQDRFEEALNFYQDALTRCTLSNNVEEWMVFHIRGEIANCTSFIGHSEETERLYQDTYRGCLQSLGVKSVVTLNMQFKLAYQMLKWGKDVEALDMFRDNVQNTARYWGKDNPDTLKAVDTLIKLLDYSGQNGEADELRKRFER